MSKKFIWLIVSCLMVAALVLASCAPKVLEEKEAKVVTKEPEKKVEEVVEPAVGVPQYGGRLTWFGAQNNVSPASWDQCDLQWQGHLVVPPCKESLLHADIDKYGPRGTNESAFVSDLVPDAYLTGHIAESWEVSPDRIVFHIRPGIMWADSPTMGSRELTADDVVHSLSRLVAARRIKHPAAVAFIDDIIAEDKYTVVVETNVFNAGWSVPLAVGRFTHIQPPELVEAGAADWRNHISVGTGPFLLADYVKDTLVTYVKNPNYWGTTTIDGVEYKIPFVDTLRLPLIKDDSTRIAALRTGKLDWSYLVPLRYEDTLRQTSPDLILVKRPASNTTRVHIRHDRGPCQDINVRRALSIAIDQEAILEAMFTEGILHAFPLNPGAGPAFTPFDELPAEAQMLYDYNPELASKMLREAGVPEGFEMSLMFNPKHIQEADACAMIAAMWGEIGIDVELRGVEAATMYSLTTYPGDYGDAVMGSNPSTDPLWMLPNLIMHGNTLRWTDEWAREELAVASAEVDSGKRNATLKKLAVYVLEQAAVIPIGLQVEITAYWPWLKNYYGEVMCAYRYNASSAQARLWIDQDMKAEMGY